MTFKRYILCWTAVGAAIPILVAIISLFMPKPPDFNPFEERRPTPRQRTVAVVATVLYPAFVVDEVLSLVVTDSGGDSGAHIAGTIIFGISVVLNAFVYALAGVFTWMMGALLRTLIKSEPG